MVFLDFLAKSVLARPNVGEENSPDGEISQISYQKGRTAESVLSDKSDSIVHLRCGLGQSVGLPTCASWNFVSQRYIAAACGAELDEGGLADSGPAGHEK